MLRHAFSAAAFAGLMFAAQSPETAFAAKGGIPGPPPGRGRPPANVPEIDPGALAGALVIVTGGLAILIDRVRRG